MLRPWLEPCLRRCCQVCSNNHNVVMRRAAYSSNHYNAARIPPVGKRNLTRRFFQSSAEPAAAAESSTSTPSNGNFVPLRKQLKDEARAKKKLARNNGSNKPRKSASAAPNCWELTVGIEVHAQLDTDTKLFSRASAAIDDSPNTNVALFDLAYPGAQPLFQPATLIPALRAAIAFNCDVQRTSYFDRKHYFYQDQPAGYQITQFYEPYARDGNIWLYRHDGIAPEDGEKVQIGIKQIQMEQDTAKSQELPSSVYLLDFNRVSRPLIEIITLPQIHSPATAAACVRKIQAILQACGAVTTGMEMGGLRADVNVSVRRVDDKNAHQQYHGITGLGQRTEIKNLSSFKAVEDAITAERDRQIAILEAGGVIEGETRGWAIGSTETRKLRGKEGEVDYRYMPDPDLAPVIIGDDILGELRSTMPMLPDEALDMLISDPKYGLSVEDAKTLLELDDGARLEYYQDTVDILLSLQLQSEGQAKAAQSKNKSGKTVGNWVLHELGGLFSKSEVNDAWDAQRVPAQSLAEIIHLLGQSKITASTAKSLLATIFDGDNRGRCVQQIVEEENLFLRPLSTEDYIALAEQVINQNPEMAQQIREKGQMGKIGWFVGQIMRAGEKGRVEAQKAEEVLRDLLLK